MGPFLCASCHQFCDEVDEAEEDFDGRPLCISCVEQIIEIQD